MRKTYRHIEQTFEPVFDMRSRILILGSFPSEESRKNGFYYGNSRNRFWNMLQTCCGFEPEEFSNDQKKSFLLEHGLALWDVIESCDIKGSADASIKNVKPADILKILDATHIDKILCNGATAYRLFKKYLQYLTALEPVVLPSTSPANAKWSLSMLVGRWQEELGACRPLSDAELKERKASGRYEYHAVHLNAPKASNYAVHKSMQGNKRKDTKPELLVREQLQRAGLTGYRLQWKVPGRPDIAWPGKKVALFINGCFWHRCPRCNPSTPKKNVEYWEAKFASNQTRDRKNLEALHEDGWITHVIWECELKKDNRDATFKQLFTQLSRELGKPLKTDEA